MVKEVNQKEEEKHLCLNIFYLTEWHEEFIYLFNRFLPHLSSTSGDPQGGLQKQKHEQLKPNNIPNH